MHADPHIENLTLRQHLETLLQEARQNEEKLRRFDQLERRIIGAATFVELLQLLLDDYRQVFGIERVSLTLIDREYEIPRLLAEAGLGETLPGLNLIEADVSLLSCFRPAEENPETCLAAFTVALHGSCFDDSAPPPASVALLPLVRQGRLLGSLNLGSADVTRYTAAAGTQFLDRLAAVVAVCIESALTRERLKHAGVTDVLTGVHNRRYFEHRCLEDTSQAMRQQQPLACMFLDIDYFKRINDTHGHQVGDQVLRSVAHAIKQQLRGSDMLARYGGEEFVVLLPQTVQQHALEIAERIRLAVGRLALPQASGAAVVVSISIGLSILPLSACNKTISTELQASNMLAAADQALYRAKHLGRNRVVSAGENIAGSVDTVRQKASSSSCSGVLQRIWAALSPMGFLKPPTA
jgi:diguanylate cyclase (GGDEF)-like protein